MNIGQTIEQALNWRYAVKKFDSTKKISATDWKVLADSLVKAPSSYGLQPWKFVVIENMKLREQLKPVSWNQSQITDASHMVVIVAKEQITAADVHKYMAWIAQVRSLPVEGLNGFRDAILQGVVSGMTPEKMLEWTQRQTYIAMGFLLETAALLGIDSCPIEGISVPDYNRIMGYEGSGHTVVAVVTLGYRHLDDAAQKHKKVRFPDHEVIEYRK